MNKDLNIKELIMILIGIKQGVLLLNSALMLKRETWCHLKLWQPYTNYIIDYISKNHKD